MKRVVEPEILDQLKPEDPRAIRARRDLKRINFWMGNARWIAKALQQAFPQSAPARLVELGSGDGSLLLRVARQLPWKRGHVHLSMIDREPAVLESTLAQYKELGWTVEIVAADVFDWLRRKQPSDCILANLFLHHFSNEQLRELFSHAAAQTNCLIASEPPRSRMALFSCRLMPLIGIGEVALNDAYVSIRAGFQKDDLSKLWPKNKDWKLEERTAGLFSHLFIAQRSKAD
ncbi:MAG: class I SAM-dependent methyltransferase [Limisphaerales bacterium]